MTQVRAFLEWMASNSGLAEWGLLLIALPTAIFAAVQIRDGRALRYDQARPYVAVGMRRIAHGVVELYVKNFGQTVAHDVHISSDPPLESVSDSEAFRIFDQIPTLVPGEEWATIWETAAYERSEAGDFSNRYTVTLAYEGSDAGKRVDHKEDFVIDWSVQLKTTYMEQKTIHDVAKSMKKIEAVVSPHRYLKVGQFGSWSVQLEEGSPESAAEPVWRRVQRATSGLWGKVARRKS